MESLREIDELLMPEKAWDDLMNVSKQISKEWKGPSALEEIQSQREKEW